MSGNSLAFSTGTRVDSAAKHIMACKIDTQMMKAFAGRDGVTLHDLDHQKLDFLTEKDDLVLNACQKVFKSSDGAFHAYPPVISHLGKCTPHLHFFLQWLHSLRGHNIWLVINELRAAGGASLHAKVIGVYARYLDVAQTSMLLVEVDAERQRLAALAPADPIHKLFNMELEETALYQMQGYALGRAFASSISGDTVFSVLIGGCATVINGHFPMHTGQLVQWYFGCEKDQFHLTTVYTNGAPRVVVAKIAGGRKQQEAADAAGLRTAAMKRRRLEEPKRKEGCFVFPKGFVSDSDGAYHLPDRMRVFAKCINGGNPFEPVDIMIMTQSL
jgi:hypothetical protein